MGLKCDLSDFDQGLIVGARFGGLSISKTADLLGISVPKAWVICIYVKVPLMRMLMLEFWRDICCCQDDNFSQELHVYFHVILHELK